MKRNYKETDKLTVAPGDVIKVLFSVYDESIITNTWLTHFVDRVKFLRVDDINNHGKIVAHDKSGKRVYCHAYEERVIAAYRAV